MGTRWRAVQAAAAMVAVVVTVVVAKATATYTTGTGLTPEATVTLTEKDGTPKSVTIDGKAFTTYSPKKELNKIVANKYLGADTDVDTELRIESSKSKILQKENLEWQIPS